MFIKNKHVITAMIIAPISVIISYFAVDYYVSEVPHKAQQGELYKMLVKPNCRWESGQCDLVNGDFKISITPKRQALMARLNFLLPLKALEGINFALVNQRGDDSLSIPANWVEENRMLWKTRAVEVNKFDYLQLVISVNGATFYTEVPAVIIDKDKPY
ncbi:MAG: hypothetical protein Rpha_0489 [Candidatus Ruthia sp. Apha_13_S6]|nr:hypothetical protein [Candidatus Ruthia sp. Apha_13_S6]